MFLRIQSLCNEASREEKRNLKGYLAEWIVERRVTVSARSVRTRRLQSTELRLHLAANIRSVNHVWASAFIDIQLNIHCRLPEAPQFLRTRAVVLPQPTSPPVDSATQDLRPAELPSPSWTQGASNLLRGICSKSQVHISELSYRKV